MEYIENLSAVWGSFADRDVAGAAYLHISNTDVGYDLRTIQIGGHSTLLAVLLSVEANTRLNLARSFKVRYPHLAREGRIWEQIAISSSITRVALLEVEDADNLEQLLQPTAIRDRLRIAVALEDVSGGPVLVDRLISDDILQQPTFQAQGVIVWILRNGMRLGAVAIRPEDDLAGQPGVAFYGAQEQVKLIYESTRNFITRRARREQFGC